MLTPLANCTLPAAVLWDMDGTIIDSERYWIAASRELIEQYGGTLSTLDERLFIGASMTRTAELVIERGVPLPVGKIIPRVSKRVRILLSTRGIPWRPGVVELLRLLSSVAVRTALVTMSYADTVEVLLRHMRRSAVPAFDVVVAGDDITSGKPAPEPYLKALSRLGSTPEQCLAFEDSAIGATSALAAGVPTVIVPNLTQVNLPGAIVKETLATLDLGAFGNLWRSAQAELSKTTTMLG